jgi:predicted amidophosphoribosyltransferase
MKCKKHDIGMEVAPGGHLYCPECEAEDEDQTVCSCCGEPTKTMELFLGRFWMCSVCGEPL